MTHHPNSILNPDVVKDWAREEKNHPARIKDRAERSKAISLWPNLPDSDKIRAQRAAELWADAARMVTL